MIIYTQLGIQSMSLGAIVFVLWGSLCKVLSIKATNSQGHNLYKLKYISLEEVKIVSFQQ